MEFLSEFLLPWLTVETFWGVVTGIIIGGLINTTGVGGGVLIIPILTVGFSLTPVVAVGTGSIYATLTKLLSSYYQIKSREVNWRITLWFLLGALPSTIVSTWLVVDFVHNFPEQSEQLQQTIRYLIIVVMVLSALLTLRPTPKNQEHKEYLVWILFVGIIIGCIMALTGIGGGILIIPALALLTNEGMKRIVRCSIVIAFIISATSGAIYSKGGIFDMNLLVAMLIGSSVGIFFSNKIFTRINEKKLKPMVVGIILFSAVLMLFS